MPYGNGSRGNATIARTAWHGLRGLRWLLWAAFVVFALAYWLDPTKYHNQFGNLLLWAEAVMTEFAFSGLGINPHYGTPLNPYDRGAGRIPGGSSSGAAVSVTDAMAFGALGTDTGGSCRIPAALCGIVGFKPTARRVPTAGAFPLSTSLDSVGPLAATVA